MKGLLKIFYFHQKQQTTETVLLRFPPEIMKPKREAFYEIQIFHKNSTVSKKKTKWGPSELKNASFYPGISKKQKEHYWKIDFSKKNHCSKNTLFGFEKKTKSERENRIVGDPSDYIVEFWHFA